MKCIKTKKNVKKSQEINWMTWGAVAVFFAKGEQDWIRAIPGGDLEGEGR